MQRNLGESHGAFGPGMGTETGHLPDGGIYLSRVASVTLKTATHVLVNAEDKYRP